MIKKTLLRDYGEFVVLLGDYLNAYSYILYKYTESQKILSKHIFNHYVCRNEILSGPEKQVNISSPNSHYVSRNPKNEIGKQNP